MRNFRSILFLAFIYLPLLINGFDAGTLVRTCSGDAPIELLRPGDVVTSFDAQTRRIVQRPVTHVIKRVVPCCIYLLLGGERITVAHDKKFFVPRSGHWKKAGHLKEGGEGFDACGRLHKIHSIKVVREPTELFELEIADQHTYFVGKSGILVHNPVVGAASGGGFLVGAITVLGTIIANVFITDVVHEYRFEDHQLTNPQSIVRGLEVVTGAPGIVGSRAGYIDGRSEGVLGAVQGFIADVAGGAAFWVLKNVTALHKPELRKLGIFQGYIRSVVSREDSAVAGSPECDYEALLALEEAREVLPAPGVPHKSDGFDAPTFEVVCSPIGLYGWRDVVGNIWTPTGPCAMTDSHWLVQLPDGSCVSVYPGGSVRPGDARALVRTAKEARKKRAERLAQAPLAAAGGGGKPPDDPRDPRNRTSAISPNPEPPSFKRQKIRIFEDNLRHIFRDAEGHIPEDTPANRRMLEDLVSDESNYQGTCYNGKEWYAKMLPGGRQLWAEVKDGFIRNGGLNETARAFNPLTGLCKLRGFSRP